MFGRKKHPPGLSLGGVHLGWPDSGIVVSGAPGSGKTHMSRAIQRQIIAEGNSCMVVACAKPDEAGEIEALCRGVGGLRQVHSTRAGG